MAVLVDKTPRATYQTMGAAALTEAERTRADTLDRVLEDRVQKLVRQLAEDGLMPSAKGKGNLQTYWSLGKALQDVAGHTELLNTAELPLLWRAANRMYIPEQLKYSDSRGPYREHLWYCYRLASYPLHLASKMNWGEWVTIFDSAGINQEPRFDTWFRDKLQEISGNVNREFIRTFAPCINRMLKDIYVEDLSEPELFGCYEGSWQISLLWQEKSAKVVGAVARRERLQAVIDQLIGRLDDLMVGLLSPVDYATMVVNRASE